MKQTSSAPPPRRSKSAVFTVTTPSHSPLHPRSAVPFSWEHQPGVPKHQPNLGAHPPPLPLPPPLRSTSDDHSNSPDPFAAAFAQCAGHRPIIATGRRRKMAAWAAFTARLGIMGGLYGSCKSACDVDESAVCIPRASIRSGGYGVFNRRVG